MSKHGIEGLVVTYDSFDDIVRDQHRNSVLDLLKDPWSPHHDYVETLKDVDSFIRVIDWYSKPSEHGDFLNSIKESYDQLVELVFPPTQYGDLGLDIKVTSLRELPDGGAVIEYEANPKMKEFLMGQGLLRILEDTLGKGAYVKQEGVPGWEYFGDYKNYGE